MASMKPGMASWSRVTWVASVAMTLPRTGKVFWGAWSVGDIEVRGSSSLLQPLSRAMRARTKRGLRDTKWDSFIDDNGLGWVMKKDRIDADRFPRRLKPQCDNSI